METYVYLSLKIFLLVVLIRKSDGQSSISKYTSGPVVISDKCAETVCPSGTNCIQLGDDKCIGTACKPISTCVSPCTLSICEPGQACQAIKQCFGTKCHFAANCVAVCDGFECPRDKVCRPRRVNCDVPPCHPVATCVSPCDDVTCAPDQECVVNRRGKPKCQSPCSSISCKQNEICQLDLNGIIPKPICVENPCNDVICPNSEKCFLKRDQCGTPSCPVVAVCGLQQENSFGSGNSKPLVVVGNSQLGNNIEQQNPNKEDCPLDVPSPPDVILQKPAVSLPKLENEPQPKPPGAPPKPNECDHTLCPSQFCALEPPPGYPGCWDQCHPGCFQCKVLLICGIGGCGLRSMCYPWPI